MSHNFPTAEAALVYAVRRLVDNWKKEIPEGELGDLGQMVVLRLAEYDEANKDRCTCGQNDSDTAAWYGETCPVHGPKRR